MYRRSLIAGVVLALIVLAVLPVGAGPGGTDRPFKATLVGELSFAIETDCPNPMGVLTMTHSSGNATHMGNVTADWAHCPTAEGFLGSSVDMVGANGDLIHIRYDEVLSGTTFTAYIEGGTGRFEGAVGEVQMTFGTVPQFLPDCEPTPEDPCYNPFVPWPWWGSMDGTISY